MALVKVKVKILDLIRRYGKSEVLMTPQQAKQFSDKGFVDIIEEIKPEKIKNEVRKEKEETEFEGIFPQIKD